MSNKLDLLKNISQSTSKYLITLNIVIKNIRTSFIKNLKIILRI
jgi:hypothetical protein